MTVDHGPGDTGDSARVPTVIEAVGIAMLAIALAFSTGVAVGAVFPDADAASPALTPGGIAAQLAYIGVMIGAVVAFARRHGAAAQLGLVRPEIGVIRAVILGGSVGIGLQAAIAGAVYFAGRLLPGLDTSQISGPIERVIADAPTGSKIALVIISVLGAPIGEEMYFRGVLLAAVSHRIGRWPAIVVSALTFGLAHFNLYSFALLAIVGVVLAVLVIRTKSLVTAVACHITFNSVAVIGLLM